MLGVGGFVINIAMFLTLFFGVTRPIHFGENEESKNMETKIIYYGLLVYHAFATITRFYGIFVDDFYGFLVTSCRIFTIFIVVGLC